MRSWCYNRNAYIGKASRVNANSCALTVTNRRGRLSNKLYKREAFPLKIEKFSIRRRHYSLRLRYDGRMDVCCIPVCIRMCSWRLVCCEKALEQTSQRKFFSVVWIMRCFRSVEQSVNARSHTSQTNLRRESGFVGRNHTRRNELPFQLTASRPCVFACASLNSMTCWTLSSKRYNNIPSSQCVWTCGPVNCSTDGNERRIVYRHKLCRVRGFACVVWNCTWSFWSKPDTPAPRPLRPANLAVDSAFWCERSNWFSDWTPCRTFHIWIACWDCGPAYVCGASTIPWTLCRIFRICSAFHLQANEISEFYFFFKEREISGQIV